MPGYQGLALALLPAVTVGSGAGPLELAVMPLVTDTGTLGTAAQGLGQPTGAALKDILVDMLSTSPGEGACVITTDDTQGGGVSMGCGWEDHGHQGGLLCLRMMR